MRLTSARWLHAGRAALAKRRVNPFYAPGTASPSHLLEAPLTPLENHHVFTNKLQISQRAPQGPREVKLTEGIAPNPADDFADGLKVDLADDLKDDLEDNLKDDLEDDLMEDLEDDFEDSTIKRKKRGVRTSGYVRTVRNVNRRTNKALRSLQQPKVLSWDRGHGAITMQELRTHIKEPMSQLSAVSTLLGLAELDDKQLPGMEFNLENLTLSVSKPFLRQVLYASDPDHHLIKPWIAKALLTRAESWSVTDKHDFNMLFKDGSKQRNNLLKQHRGQCLSNFQTLFSLANRGLKRKDALRSVTKCISITPLGPKLPVSLTALQSGFLHEDVSVHVEHSHDLQFGPGSERRIASIWVAINAPFRMAERSFRALAGGEMPPWDSDVFTPILYNLGKWLRKHHREPQNKQSNGRAEDMEQVWQPNHRPSFKPVRLSGTSASVIPEFERYGPIPVIFAFRQKFIWFAWHGGFRGKFVAQYASHWLPTHRIAKVPDFDAASELQQDVLRRSSVDEAGEGNASMDVDSEIPQWNPGQDPDGAPMVKLTPTDRVEVWEWAMSDP